MADQIKKAGPFDEIGTSGLMRTGGYVQDEFLQELQGKAGAQMYREMSLNDDMIGGALTVLEQVARQAPTIVEPFDESPAAAKQADFVDEVINDMNRDWASIRSEIFTEMLIYGWVYAEKVFKLRHGWNPNNGRLNSKHNDGLLGVRKLATRAQDTLQEWIFDEEGGIQAMIQLAPPDYLEAIIPIQKALLFRTRIRRNNPEGQALDPATPVPTPDGWKNFGDLFEGDRVFDEEGRIRYVVARREWSRRPRYRLRFNDGTSIIADANHQWLTTLVHERSSGMLGKVRTTDQIIATLKNSNGVSNHGIHWAGPLDYPEQFLVVDPYFLGLWLGDGNSRQAKIYCHTDDAAEVTSHIRSCGYSTSVARRNGQSVNGREIGVYGPDGPRSYPSVKTLLVVLGVVQNKHIPPAYLRGSIRQRVSLLQGLMDSDGHIDKYGRCEFSNVNRSLAEGVVELVRSLGVRAYLSTKVNARGNLACLVKFTPDFGFMPFRLARKANRCKSVRARKYHYIVDAEPMELGPTVCIEVDSPSHLFLVGESMVPTHNSILRNAFIGYYFKKRIREVEGIGIERELAGMPVLTAPKEVRIWDPNHSPAVIQLGIAKNLVRAVRKDGLWGMVKPDGWTFELVSASGSRAIDTNEVINRYNIGMMISMLTDLLLVGHEKSGSWALSMNKSQLLASSITAYIDVIHGVANQHLVPDILRYNKMPVDTPPKLAIEGEIITPSIEELTDAIANLTGAGMPLFPDEAVDRHMRQKLQLPEREEGEPVPKSPEPKPDEDLEEELEGIEEE